MSKGICRWIALPKFSDERGDLVAGESLKNIPFEIKRIYHLSNVPKGMERGGHAHKNLEQVLFPVSGNFDVRVHDGFSSQTFHLREKNNGLYIGKMLWREIINFSPNAICLVLASEYHDESDYLRSYEDFLKASHKEVS